MQFFIEKMPQIQTQIDKNTQKFIFRKTWWLRMSKTLNKETIRCPGGFLEEIKAVCVEKMHQIWTEIDKKKTKKIEFLNFYANFVYFSKNLVA